MFDFAFAYTRQMQLILLFVNFLITFVCFYAIAELILTAYGEKASRGRKSLFAFFVGTLLNNVWTYCIYLLGGMLSFSPVTYALVTVPNPVFALLYYLIGFKTLGLSPARSARLMSHAYRYVIAYKTLAQFTGRLLFPQRADRPYNYLLDAVSLLLMTATVLALTLAMVYTINKRKNFIELRDAMFVKSVPGEIALNFFWAAVIYGLYVVPAIFIIGDRLWGYLFLAATIILIFAINIMWDIISVSQSKLQNSNAYISALLESTSEFRSFKHDFRNILQTYGGYIEIKDYEKLRQYHETVTNKSLNAETKLELAKKMDECPAIISLLIDKLGYADRLGVDIRIQILCSLSLPDNNLVAACRCISLLLDNAIEHAAESVRRAVVLSWSEKPNGNRLLVITNSTKDGVNPAELCEHGVAAKEGHTGDGLSDVRKMIASDPLMTLNMTFCQNEFCVYMERFVM